MLYGCQLEDLGDKQYTSTHIQSYTSLFIFLKSLIHRMKLTGSVPPSLLYLFAC